MSFLQPELIASENTWPVDGGVSFWTLHTGTSWIAAVRNWGSSQRSGRRGHHGRTAAERPPISSISAAIPRRPAQVSCQPPCLGLGPSIHRWGLFIRTGNRPLRASCRIMSAAFSGNHHDAALCCRRPPWHDRPVDQASRSIPITRTARRPTAAGSQHHAASLVRIKTVGPVSARTPDLRIARAVGQSGARSSAM